MATIDTRPAIVDVAHYGGDTLPLRVNAPVELVAGREWSAQIRSTREGAVVASFTIIPDAMGAFLTLPGEICQQLAKTGTVIRTAKGKVTRYTGEWDVQVAAPGGADPVTSLAQGKITIDLDVTREEP